MRYGFLIVLPLALVAPLSSALADECQTVFDAYDNLGKSPAYRQSIVTNGAPPIEMMAIGDNLYMKEETGWTKMPLPPGMRAEMQKKVVPSAEALKDCAEVGPDTVNGEAATVYDYTLPAMEGVGELGPQRVWISDATGLPLKMTSEKNKTEVNLSFDNVEAPLP